jgi:tRNA (guanine9-N1)-methyltransferase
MTDGQQQNPEELSKSAKKKLKRFEYIKCHRKEVRERKKLEKKDKVKELDPNPDRLCKRDRIHQEKERLKLSQSCFPKVVIDCCYESFMSEKEINKSRMQILRCYSLLKSSETKPFHLHLGNFQDDLLLSKLFNDKTPNFESMCITKFTEPVYEKFEIKDLIYLTPDSPNLLTTVEPNKVYVIGGFVDDNIKRNSSLNVCQAHGISTACLPIANHFVNPNHKQQVLTINQVFEIMHLVYNGKSWKETFEKVLPQRKGYVSVNCEDDIL